MMFSIIFYSKFNSCKFVPLTAAGLETRESVCLVPTMFSKLSLLTVAVEKFLLRLNNSDIIIINNNNNRYRIIQITIPSKYLTTPRLNSD